MPFLFHISFNINFQRNVESIDCWIAASEDGSLIPCSPAFIGQPVVSAECIFQRILKAPITIYQEFFHGYGYLEKNWLKFFRLACIISPQVNRFVLDYGKLSASLRINLDDAIHLLQVFSVEQKP
jgi:hypothetical protein